MNSYRVGHENETWSSNYEERDRRQQAKLVVMLVIGSKDANYIKLVTRG